MPWVRLNKHFEKATHVAKDEAAVGFKKKAISIEGTALRKLGFPRDCLKVTLLVLSTIINKRQN